MAVQPNIPLALTSVDTAAPINQAAQQNLQNQSQQNQNAQSTEQVLKQHYDNMGERDKQRLQSTVVGAAQLKTYLDKNDIEGAHQFLEQRKQQLQSRQAAGENVDTQETDYALDKIRRGDVQGLSTDVNAMIAAGQSYGMLGGNGVPSNVQEWNYYHSLAPADQQKYIEMKRANQLINTGDKTIVAGAGGAPITSYQHNLKPEDQPTNAYKKAEATSEGTAAGTNNAKLEDIQSQLPRLQQVVDKLSTLGKTATYTAAGNAVDSVTRQTGLPVRQGAVDRTEYISTVDNEVLPLLRQTFGAAFTQKEGESLRVTLGDPDKTPAEKDAVLRSFIQSKTGEVQSLQRRKNQGAAQPNAGGQPAVDTGDLPQGAQLIGTSNGKKVYALPDGSHVMEQ